MTNEINITYRCLKCGSTNIEINVRYNLGFNKVVGLAQDNNGCWCNWCKEQTTYGWVDINSITNREETK